MNDLLTLTSFLLKKLFFRNLLTTIISCLIFFLKIINDFFSRYFFLILTKLKLFRLINFSSWFCWCWNRWRICWIKIKCFIQWRFRFWCVFSRFLRRLFINKNLKWLFYFLWRILTWNNYWSKGLHLKFILIENFLLLLFNKFKRKWPLRFGYFFN